MRLIFLRHGIAFPYDDPACPPDPQRPLTERGIRRTRASAAGLGVLEGCPGAILTSPYLRCIETARVAARQLGFPEEEIRETRRLLFQSAPADLRFEAVACGVESVMLVGHRPHLDYVIADLLGVSRPVTSLKKAGAASVELSSTGVGALLWALPPRLLRQLGH